MLVVVIVPLGGLAVGAAPAIPVTGLDQYMEATLWPRGGAVLSHDTALDLHELCDVNPAKVHVTVPVAARIRRQAPPAYAVHVRDLDPELPVSLVQDRPLPLPGVRAAVSTSLAFGGSNAALVFSRWAGA